MELRTLRAFVEVLRFSQAAKVVFAIQSTVSKAVKQRTSSVCCCSIGSATTVCCAAGQIVYRRP